MSDVGVVDADEVNVLRGRKLYRDGAPWPRWNHNSRRMKAIWLGYHLARIEEFWERRRVMKLLGVEDELLN